MIRLAIIGTGGMAHAQVRNFKNAGGAELVCCCDIDPERSKAFAQQHGFARSYSDAAKMFSVEKLDAVSIVTPNNSHCELTLAALKHKLHVMCEKPMAMNTAEAWRMLQAARKAGTINMINFSYRQSSALHKARQLVKDGKLGKLTHVEASYLQSWLCGREWGAKGRKDNLPWRMDPKIAGSGTLGDLGCHIMDFASFVAGDITELTCRLESFVQGGGKSAVDDSVCVIARFASGALGTIHTTRLAPGQNNSIRLRVYGNEGALEVDLDKSYELLRICLGDVARAHHAWAEIRLPPRETNMAKFLAAIKSGKPESPTFEDGFKSQQSLDACTKSNRTGRAITIQ